MTPKPSFILASKSPRRQELLSNAGLFFDIVPSETDESFLPTETPVEGVIRLSQAKAKAVLAQYHNKVVLAADTVVAIGQAIFGKPADATEAKEMLRTLSGRVHWVITGLCICGGSRGIEKKRAVTSRICFRPLTDTEIDNYIAKGEYIDKAGGYAIQGDGGFLIHWIEGSYTNIVGLPLAETLATLFEVMGFDPRESTGCLPS
jgi:septum formation protein